MSAAATVLNAPGTIATSTTSLAIGIGVKSLTIQAGKSIPLGASVVLAYTTMPTTRMSGAVTSYDSGMGALGVTIDTTSGSGTYAAWTVSIGALNKQAATQAEMESGTEPSLRDMSPLRVAQAIAALGAKVISTVSATVTSSATLTAASSGYQFIQMASAGQSITLPDATTMPKVGGPIFICDNTQGTIPSGIRNSSGTLLQVVNAGGLAIVNLKDKSTAAGVWSITGSLLGYVLVRLDRQQISATAVTVPTMDKGDGIIVLSNTLVVYYGYNGTTLYLQGLLSDHWYRAVDTLFCWQPDHCYQSWRSEIERRQLPGYYRLGMEA